MKTFLTIIFVLFIGLTAQAQDAKNDAKVNTVEMTEKVSETKENSVARLYKFKNSRIKKALSFRTNANKAKLA
ncbi:MAG: hypothetical protein COA50_02155 [Flavobacteriaceae bacterium]|nr:MAG: hypothetical protein COA50_02155 [Flavobacteriaceae bacterium]